MITDEPRLKLKDPGGWRGHHALGPCWRCGGPTVTLYLARMNWRAMVRGRRDLYWLQLGRGSVCGVCRASGYWTDSRLRWVRPLADAPFVYVVLWRFLAFWRARCATRRLRAG
jgi:hypothetical protein